MDTHTIRLANAWEPSAAGSVWTRRFGRPGGLGPGDRVLLRVTSRGLAAIALNASPLPDIDATGSPWRHEITHLLRDRNTLVLRPGVPVARSDEPSSPASPTDPARGRAPLPEEVADVSLEIIPAAG